MKRAFVCYWYSVWGAASCSGKNDMQVTRGSSTVKWCYLFRSSLTSILRPPHWKAFQCFMDTPSRHCQEILSIRAMNRICDKKKVWQSSTPSVNKSCALMGPIYTPTGHTVGGYTKPFPSPQRTCLSKFPGEGAELDQCPKARKQKAHCCS